VYNCAASKSAGQANPVRYGSEIVTEQVDWPNPIESTEASVERSALEEPMLGCHLSFTFNSCICRSSKVISRFDPAGR